MYNAARIDMKEHVAFTCVYKYKYDRELDSFSFIYIFSFYFLCTL